MIYKKFGLLFIVNLLIVHHLFGSIINVPGDQGSIQAGINAAFNGDTVLVAPGIYYENIVIQEKTILLASHFLLNQDPNTVEETIVNGSSPNHADTASVLFIVSGEDDSTTINGFTITGGQGTRWYDQENGEYYREGGGIMIAYGSPIIINNYIIQNYANDISNAYSAGGGGICCEYATPLIRGNVIKYNQGRYGAGIALSYSYDAVIQNNIIAKNSGGQDFGGGGIWTFKSDGTDVRNNTIVENVSYDEGTNQFSGAGKGGGILFWEGDQLIQNNIVWFNTQTAHPLSIYLQNTPLTVVFSFNNLEDNPYSLSAAGPSSYIHNIYLDPQFADSSYLLSDNSPSIDAGHQGLTQYDLEDLSNPGYSMFPSKGGTINDQGAYGGPYYNKLYSQLTSVADQDLKTIPTNFSLEQNYPNPFNPVTTIKYSIPYDGLVSLKVYDILGKEIKTLVEEYQSNGSHQIEFHGEHLQNGVYFYELVTGNFRKIKKLTLLK